MRYTLNRALGRMAPVLTVLQGSSEFLKRERLAQMLAEQDPEGYSTHHFPPGSEVEVVFAVARTPGFFGQRRIVVCEHLLDSRLKGGRLDEALLAALRELPDTVHLVCLEGPLPDSAAAQLRERFQDRVTWIDCSVPRGRALGQWIVERVRRYGVAFTPEAVQELLERLGIVHESGAFRSRGGSDSEEGIDLARLDSELAKLSTAVFPGDTIEPSLVQALVDPNERSLGWEFLDAVREGRADLVLRELALAVANGTPPEVLLGQLASHFEVVLAATATPQQPPEVVGAATGLPVNRIAQVRRQGARADVEHAKRVLAMLRALDAGVKRGTINDTEAALAAVLVAPNTTRQPRRR